MLALVWSYRRRLKGIAQQELATNARLERRRVLFFVVAPAPYVHNFVYGVVLNAFSSELNAWFGGEQPKRREELYCVSLKCVSHSDRNT